MGTAVRGKRQRPANARAAADGMKLHRRVLRLDGRDHTVIGLRPGSTARFSTNFFHGTWHVLSDRHGALLLGRLLWGLAYQARPGTLIVIDRPFLTSTPFEADPADPIVLAPGWATPLGSAAARDLKARLPLSSPPDGTVRWRTHGLDRALEDTGAWFDANSPYWEPERGDVARLGGMIVLRPHDPVEARTWAVLSARMHAPRPHDSYTYLGPWDHCHNGEIQIFQDFRRDVRVARRARAQVLADRPDTAADPDTLRPLVWNRCGAIKRGTHTKLKNNRNLPPRAAEHLAAIGVHTLDDLQRLGPVDAYLRLGEAQTPGLTPAMLWAIDGALSGTDGEAVPTSRRNELLDELKRRKDRLERLRRLR